MTPPPAHDALRLLMPVLDGPVPAEWVIWGTTFERVCRDFYESPRHVSTEYKHLQIVRLRILLQSESELYDRTFDQWERLVGVLVDGSRESRASTRDRFIQLCSTIQAGKSVLCRKLGRFHIGLLLPGVAADDQEATDFAHALERTATDLMNVEANCEPIATSAAFRAMLRFLERQLMRDWKLRNPEAA